MCVAPMVQLSAEEEQKLTHIVLLAAGLDNEAIAAQINIGRVQVGRWRERYAQGGLTASSTICRMLDRFFSRITGQLCVVAFDTHPVIFSTGPQRRNPHSPNRVAVAGHARLLSAKLPGHSAAIHPPGA